MAKHHLAVLALGALAIATCANAWATSLEDRFNAQMGHEAEIHVRLHDEIQALKNQLYQQSQELRELQGRTEAIETMRQELENLQRQVDHLDAIVTDLYVHQPMRRSGK